MVAPRYELVKCLITGQLVRVYKGGCEVDLFNEPRFGDTCRCVPGECQGEKQDFFSSIVE